MHHLWISIGLLLLVSPGPWNPPPLVTANSWPENPPIESELEDIFAVEGAEPYPVPPATLGELMGRLNDSKYNFEVLQGQHKLMLQEEKDARNRKSYAYGVYDNHRFNKTNTMSPKQRMAWKESLYWRDKAYKRGLIVDAYRRAVKAVKMWRYLTGLKGVPVEHKARAWKRASLEMDYLQWMMYKCAEIDDVFDTPFGLTTPTAAALPQGKRHSRRCRSRLIALFKLSAFWGLGQVGDVARKYSKKIHHLRMDKLYGKLTRQLDITCYTFASCKLIKRKWPYGGVNETEGDDLPEDHPQKTALVVITVKPKVTGPFWTREPMLAIELAFIIILLLCTIALLRRQCVLNRNRFRERLPLETAGKSSSPSKTSTVTTS